MSNRSPSVSPLASPLRRMQAAGVTGRINPYCSRRANFRSVKEVRACLAAISDSPSVKKKVKSPIAPSSYMIKTPPSRRSSHNVITPEARIMMKEAVAEFSSPLTDVKKIPMRASPIFPLPASKRRKLFDMKDEILKEVERNKAEMKEKEKKMKKSEVENVKPLSKDPKLTGDKKDNSRKTCDEELLEIQEIYPEFKFSNPRSLTAQTPTDSLTQFNEEFRFSNAESAKQNKSHEESLESPRTTKVPSSKIQHDHFAKDKSKSTPTAPIVTIDKELAERFKPPEGSWECEVCMINNKSEDSVCIACTAQKPASLCSQPVPAKTSVQPDKELMARFRMGADKWECDTCMIQNSQSDDKCLACEAPKPGSHNKESATVKADTKLTLSTGLQLNIKPSESATSGSLGGGVKIPGFSLGPVTRTTQSDTNPVAVPLTLNFPPLSSATAPVASKIDFGLSLLKQPTSGSTISLSSITPSSGNSLFKIDTASKPVTSTPQLTTSSAAHSQTSESAAVTTATATAPVLTSNPVTSTSPPSLSLSNPFPSLLPPLSSSQSRETVTSTTYSLPLSQSTPALLPSAPVAPLASPPRASHLSLPPPMTPQKSVDEEAMEVIPFSGTLTTPVKGASSVPTSSPFNFLANPTANQQAANPTLSVPTQVSGNTQPMGASSVAPAANESIFKGMSTQFQFSGVPPSFQFGGNPVGGRTRQQPVTDNSTGQELKPFQFKASSQPIPQFAQTANPPQSNSQPDTTPNPSFTPNQPTLSNLFGAQPKQSGSLFTLQPQSSNFPGITGGGSLFNTEPPKMTNSNLFKQANQNNPASFQFTQKSQAPMFTPGVNFQFAANPAAIPAAPANAAPFSFTGAPAPQPNTPTTPQAPGFNFNVGSNTASNQKGRVYKTAKRRLK